MTCAVPSGDGQPRAASLEHLGLIGFVPVMGLSGLALAWMQAAVRMGEVASLVAQATGVLAGVLMLALLGITLWRFVRWPLTRVHDAAHPVRHVFVAAPTVSLLLLATCGAVLAGPSPLWDALWMAGAAAQAAVTGWVVLRWLRSGTSRWMGVTPALLIPVVGNVLLPLAGLALGHPVWAAVQWAVGAVLWPVVLWLLAQRLQRLGPWPARMRASVFILIAPPSVMGLGLMLWQTPLVWPLVLWGLALALLVLALASVVVAALLRWTWWGLRSGDLLQPEPNPAPKP